MCIVLYGELPMADSNEISVKIEGSGLSFVGKVSLRQAIEMLRIASLTSDEVTTLSHPPAAASNKEPKSMHGLSLREAVDHAAPKTSAETIAVIGAWLMDEEGLEDLSRQDIRDRYQDARLAAPGNYPRDFSAAVQKGFLAPTKADKNRFYVTKTGRKLLEGVGNGS
jgi:hypothetical protein